MPRRPRQLAESGVYHVVLRGVNRDAVFLEDEDFERFLSVLRAVRDATGCRVLAYCLMTNHVHLVLRTTDEPVGLVLKRLGIRYAGWFNRKYGRVGHFFQDRFVSRPVEDDAYLLTVLRYVWNNPVKAGICERPQDYRWSSRRFLEQDAGGRPVDGEELHRLVPARVLAEIAGPAPERIASVAEPAIGRPLRHTDAEVVSLFRTASGVGDPREFRLLDPIRQRTAISELRTRSVSYDQIARVTGLSASTVKRRHASSVGRARPEDAGLGAAGSGGR